MPAVFFNRLEEQHLDLSTTLFSRSQTRGHYTGLVENQDISFSKIFRQVAEAPVRELFARSVENQQSRVGAPGGRVLRDELGGKRAADL